MIAFLRSPLGAGILAFVAAMIVISMFMGPTVCSSGWASSSIGRQGACSHHGGVNRLPAMLRFAASSAFGIWVGFKVAGLGRASEPAPPSPFAPADGTGDNRSAKRFSRHRRAEGQPNGASSTSRTKTQGTTCPDCGEPMRALSEAGKIMLSCPKCGHAERYR